MRSLFCLLICFFIENASATPILKRLCITSRIHNHVPTDQLALKDIKKQQFYVFVELKNCENSKFFLKITTSEGTLKRTFYTRKAQRYRVSFKFVNISHVKNIKVTDAAGNTIGKPIVSAKVPSDKKISKKEKPSGIKNLLQSMQDKK